MRKPDPVEIVAVSLPVIVEAAVVIFIIGAIFVLSVTLSGRLPL